MDVRKVQDMRKNVEHQYITEDSKTRIYLSVVREFNEKGEISGILAEASTHESDRMKHRWDQEQHSLTHTLVIRDSANVKQGDYLTTAGRTFLVLLCEDPGNLGATGLIYLEERNDLK